jgi:D-glycerate 3-kinase
MAASTHTTRIKGMPRAAKPTRSAGFSAEVVGAVLDDALAAGDRVYAIAGLQGSGKSTLAAQISALGRARGLRVAVLSLDDTYLGLRDRRRLAREVHPLLATRGPPGTHDLALACETLDALRDGRRVRAPRFDKLRDRRLPPSRWPWVDAADLVLLEGWCLKLPAQSARALRRPINTLERERDPDCVWRHYCNGALERDYPALWSRLPRLLWLQPPGFEPIPNWRWQQERSAIAHDARHPGMSRTEVTRFVQHFERYSRHALRTMPAIADLRLRLDARRRVRSRSILIRR